MSTYEKHSSRITACNLLGHSILAIFEIHQSVWYSWQRSTTIVCYAVLVSEEPKHFIKQFFFENTSV